MKAIVMDKGRTGYYLVDTFIDDDKIRHRLWGADMLDAMLFESEKEAQDVIDAFLCTTDAYIVDALEP